MIISTCAPSQEGQNGTSWCLPGWAGAPSQAPVLSVWPRAQVPTCQAARSQSDVEMGQACPRPLRRRELWRQEASVLTHVTGRSGSSGTPAGQVTPRPTTKRTARSADPWAIARAHTLVKAADLPAGHVRSFRGDSKAPRRTLPLNVPGLDCHILTSDTDGIECDEGSAGLFPEEKGRSLCRSRSRTTHARATSGHVLVTQPGLGSHLSGSALWGWRVRGGGNQATDRQTTNRQTVLSSAQGPGRACDWLQLFCLPTAGVLVDTWVHVEHTPDLKRVV